MPPKDQTIPKDEILRQWTRTIDSLVIAAKNESDLRRKLHVLEKNGRGGWMTMRCPVWIGNTLVAVVIRPSKD